MPTPTGCLEADLESLASIAACAVADGVQPLIRILPELPRLPAKQQSLVREALYATQAAFVSLFRHYVSLGELTAQPADGLWMTFMGPILIAAHHTELWQQPLQFDSAQHVQLFLDGCSPKQRQ